jgi:hypothetical protein
VHVVKIPLYCLVNDAVILALSGRIGKLTGKDVEGISHGLT